MSTGGANARMDAFTHIFRKKDPQLEMLLRRTDKNDLLLPPCSAVVPWRCLVVHR
jgi:hypothetical protein